jgi:hypothetical protein
MEGTATLQILNEMLFGFLPFFAFQLETAALNEVVFTTQHSLNVPSIFCIECSLQTLSEY